MGKHQKKLRSEKAKVKLKGAKLPKGANETKGNLKIKKIVLKEQLKDSLVEDGKRIQTIKEILGRLKNSNTTYRMDGLKSLKENLTLQKLLPNFGEIIQTVCSLSLDIEKDIRRESFKVLSMILQVVQVESIKPFFPVIISYLGCAMTHIQQGILEDSLLFLDVLSSNVPTLVASNSDKIFSNFLNMISKLHNESNSKRSLTINTSGNMTTVKWRRNVLERLREMLGALLNHRKGRNHYEFSNQATVDAIYFTINRPVYVSVMRNFSNVNSNLSKLLNRTVTTDDKVYDEQSQLKSYIQQLMPVIFDTWLEVRLPTHNSDENCQKILTFDAAQTLKTALEIFEHLWRLVTISESNLPHNKLSMWFMKKFREDFGLHFFTHFPYQQQEGSKENKKKSKGQPTVREVAEAGGQYCLRQNLGIVYLFCVFSNHSTDNSNLLEKTLNYMANVDLKGISSEDGKYYEKALRAILFTCGVSFLKINHSKTTHLLKSVLEAYNNNTMGYEMRIKLMALLCDIILDDKLQNMYGKPIFDIWLPSLPKLLCSHKTSAHAMKALLNLGKQKNTAFLNALRDSAMDIIENIETIEVVDIKDQFEGKKLIMNLFFWISDWSTLRCEDIINHINIKVSNPKILDYFSYIIKQSFSRSNHSQ